MLGGLTIDCDKILSVPILSYKELIVWQKNMELVITVYTCTEKFPKSEMFGLTSQMRRAAVSIPSTIAEGRNIGSRTECRRFITMAFGSGAELETQVEIAKKRSFGSPVDCKLMDKLLDEIMRMLHVIQKKLAS